MNERLALHHVALRADSPTLALSVGPGQWVAVMGPAGSGKSRLLRVLAGLERPALGAVEGEELALYVTAGALPRRARLMTLARPSGRPISASQATDALLAARLWDRRNATVAELSPGQVAAAELLSPLVSDSPTLLLDGQLDRLDPWTLSAILETLRNRRAEGNTLIFATHRPDLAEMCDAVIVLREERVRFAGSVEDLRRQAPPHRFVVRTEHQPDVRNLVDPFAVEVESTPAGLEMRAEEGQSLAARLLLEGYGDVQLVLQRPPTLEEALHNLLN